MSVHEGEGVTRQQLLGDDVVKACLLDEEVG